MRPVPDSKPIVRSRTPWGMWWAISGAWWALNGLTHASSRASMNGQSFMESAKYDFISAALWVPFTVLAFWLAERAPVTRISWPRTVPLVVGAASAVVLVRALFVIATDPFIHWYTNPPVFSDVLITSITNNFFLFFLFVGAGHALVYARRIREREELLSRAELQHLKAQLHPHFLFNTLNAISAYVRAEPDTAIQMITRLSTLLRHALQRAHTQEVSLEEELSIVAAYVDIEQVRFDERLRVVWQIAPDTLSATVPHLLLQPLVENAIRHGFSSLSRLGTVEIRTERHGNALHLLVRDDGVGLPASALAQLDQPIVTSNTSHGIGLSNARERLRQLYGDAHTFLLAPRQPHGLDVRIVLPFRPFSRG
ncbi:MAG: histidine kinase [Gemmatimonadaceae bacterium]|nr:histidine kinase [Gemmatimonadaceae bacterium]